MKAALFDGAHKPLRIEDMAKPAFDDDQMLVRVAACGLCHTDLHYIDHDVPTFHPPPLVLGHEISGTVAAVGRNVVNFKEGDRVLLPAVVSCGKCSLCRTGRENICESMKMYGNHIPGGYAEYVLAWASQAFHLPQSIPLEEGAIIADAITTPFHAVVNRARVRSGDKVVVVGCGGIGLNVIQFCSVAGAGRIIAVDVQPEKLELAKSLGATDTLNATEVERIDSEIRFRTQGGADVAFECIGRTETQKSALGCIRNGGTAVFVGYNPDPLEINSARIMFRELKILGSLGCRSVDYPRVIRLVELGKIRVKELVSHKFTLDRINEGLDVLRSGRAVRAIVLPGTP